MRTDNKSLLFYLLGVPSLVVTVFVALNSVDEKPTPEVAKLLDWQVPPHGLDDSNGYLVLRGLEAPADQDATAVGRAVVDADVARFRSKARFQPAPLDDRKVDVFLHLKALQCNYADAANCLDFYLARDRATMDAAFSAVPQLMARYRAIVASPAFIEVLTPRADVAFPPYASLTAASEYQRVKAIDDIADGKLDQGLAVFVENAMFSRRLLADSSTLIAHMIALAMVQHDIRLLGELLEKYPQLADHTSTLAPLLAPIDGEHYSIGHTMDYETAFSLHAIVEAHTRVGEGDSILGHGLGFLQQTNATLNLVDRLMNLQREVMSSPASRIDKARVEYAVKREKELGLGVGNFFLYNPMGKIVEATGEAKLADYAERHLDTDADIRLVALQAQLIAGHAAEGQVADAVAHAGAAMRNPYDGQPMKWNLAKHTLSFTGHQPSSAMPGRSKTWRVHLVF